MSKSATLFPPGSTIGILGGGQLGRMLAIAAAEMGYSVHIYAPEPDSPAAEVAASHTVAAYADAEALKHFAQSVDVITYEFENIPVATTRILSAIKPVLPSPEVLEVCQHRVREKELCRSLGIGTAPFAAVRDLAGLKSAAAGIGYPCVLKTCRMGYDGKGQAMIRSEGELDAAWAKLKTDDAILEGFVDFTMEVSVIVARNAHGEMACFPLVQNIHRDHILHRTIAPAPVPDALAQEAERIARTLAEALSLVGILAVEMFVTKDGRLLVNEMAPRPHNSGHWTIDACTVSQFEQTVRAVCGLPLGSVARLCDAEMLNLIGSEIDAWEQYLKQPNARLHLYGKKEARVGRKMGHVTVLKNA